jgi:hypothetical protein
MRLTKLIIIFLLFHLKLTAQTNIELIIKTNTKVDSIDAMDFSQKEFFKSQYKDTINFSFKKANIDLYNIGGYIRDKKYWKQIWLDTGNIKILIHFDSSKLIIDTVINSPTYYRVMNFNKEYTDIVKTHDTLLINNFLLNNLNKNIENPFSLWVGMLYLNVNQNVKINLFALKNTFIKQGDRFKWFLLYPIVLDRMNNILSIDKIEISKFKFINKQDQITHLDLNGAKYYVLDFWFLGCAPCREEQFYRKQHENNWDINR